jgi:coenzyme PQQ biosynthesis protein PqqD
LELKPDSSFVPKLAKKARLRFDRHSGGHMIIYPERGLALNDSAAEIAKRCDGKRTVAEIAEDLASTCESCKDVPASDLRADVVAFVEDLAAKGLLEP